VYVNRIDFNALPYNDSFNPEGSQLAADGSGENGATTDGKYNWTIGTVTEYKNRRLAGFMKKSYERTTSPRTWIDYIKLIEGKKNVEVPSQASIVQRSCKGFRFQYNRPKT